MIAMTSHINALHLLSLCLWKLAMTSTLKTSFSQETRFITVNAGGTETLQCFREVSGHFFLWFKQSLGQEPRLISTFYQQNEKAFFQPDFEKERRRFLVDIKGKNHHLTIKNLQESDSATYYCAYKHVNTYTFGNGTSVHVRGSGRNSTALVHQPSTGNIQSQESMSCTVQTGSCGGQHSVYWFRGPGQTHPGLIYTQGGSSERCGSNRDTADTQPHMCAYNIKSHNISHADTKCAVAACGQAVFKTGSKQRNEYEANASDTLVHFLNALLISIIIVAFILLVILIAKLQRRENCLCKAKTSITSPSHITPEAENQDPNNLQYAALLVHRKNRSRSQMDKTLSECIYSSMKN